MREAKRQKAEAKWPILIGERLMTEGSLALQQNLSFGKKKTLTNDQEGEPNSHSPLLCISVPHTEAPLIEEGDTGIVEKCLKSGKTKQVMLFRLEITK